MATICFKSWIKYDLLMKEKKMVSVSNSSEEEGEDEIDEGSSIRSDWILED